MKITCVTSRIKNSYCYQEGGPTFSATNSVALVRERTKQTERPPLDGEVSADLG
jgi:hypothetical protein